MYPKIKGLPKHEHKCEESYKMQQRLTLLLTYLIQQKFTYQTKLFVFYKVQLSFKFKCCKTPLFYVTW